MKEESPTPSACGSASPAPEIEVIGLGVGTLDLLAIVNEFPGEEMVQAAEASTLQGGGPIATAMVTLARLGARAAMIDRIGDDWRGRLIVEEFEQEGVSTRWLQTAAGHTSSIASILVRKRDGARTIVYSPGDSGEVDPAEVPNDLFATAKILHLNGRHLQASLALAQKAREKGMLVSFDGGAHRYRPEVTPLLHRADIQIIARQFACAFSGSDDPASAAKTLLEAGARIVAITDGLNGSWIFPSEEESFHQKAFDAGEPVDTTGAGDAYHGAFLYGVARGFTMRACALLASAVAALNTRALGGRAALPSLAEVTCFLKQHGHTLPPHSPS